MAELDLTNISSTSIATPASGVTALFTDLDKRVKSKDDAGKINSLGDFNNFSVAAQSLVAATRTYIVGSQTPVPAGKLQIGTIIRWTLSLTKTAAGVAASTFDVAIGIAGTTADNARLSFTKPAGTAVADEGKVVIAMTVRGPLSASGVITGEFSMIHNLAATGHMTIPAAVVNAVSSAFDVTVANLFVGLCITTGAADAITIQQVITEVFNL